MLRRDGAIGVMIVRGDKAHFHALPNAIEGQPVHLFLPASTQIIEKNRYRAKHGTEVLVENAESVK